MKSNKTIAKSKKIPAVLQPFLWSYDIKKMDLKRDKKRIITNILNLGNQQATDWLFKIYSKQNIKKIVNKPLAGEWSKKSLNFWSLVLGVRPELGKRRIIK